jgi:CheY-like chemotaxis protein
MAVDDEHDALGLLRDTLEIAGARVSTMTSAPAVLERIAELTPDVLVADIGMPGMDGYDLIKQVRSSTVPAVRDIPAAALTAFARSDDRAKALKSGFELHLSKPVDPGELVAAVASLVRRRRKESLGS